MGTGSLTEDAPRDAVTNALRLRLHLNPRQQKIDIQPKFSKFYYFIFMFLAKNAIPCYLKHPLKPKTWYTPPFVVLEVVAPLAN